MIFILLCILSSTLIFVIFKSIDKKGIPTLEVIIYNYLVASLLGFALAGNESLSGFSLKNEWLPLSIGVGVLFILMFFVVGKSSQVAGISITTVASKMSVVTPILFSILSDPNDELNTLKIVGIGSAILAVYLTVYKKNTPVFRSQSVFLPLVLFLGMGMVDSLVKYSQLKYIGDSELPLFSAMLFLFAFLTGILFLPFSRNKLRNIFSPGVILWGLFLGLSNYGSIYFLVRALNYRAGTEMAIDSSIVFGINNSGIVVLSIIAGFLLFRERLERLNYLGILLALFSILIFSYA